MTEVCGRETKVAIFDGEDVPQITAGLWHGQENSVFFKEGTFPTKLVEPLYRSISPDFFYHGMEVREFDTIDTLTRPVYISRWHTGVLGPDLTVELVTVTGERFRRGTEVLYELAVLVDGQKNTMRFLPADLELIEDVSSRGCLFDYDTTVRLNPYLVHEETICFG